MPVHTLSVLFISDLNGTINLDENRYKNRYNQIEKQARYLKLLKVDILQRHADSGFMTIFQLFQNIQSSPAKRVCGESCTEGSNPSLSARNTKRPTRDVGRLHLNR